MQTQKQTHTHTPHTPHTPHAPAGTKQWRVRARDVNVDIYIYIYVYITCRQNVSDHTTHWPAKKMSCVVPYLKSMFPDVSHCKRQQAYQTQCTCTVCTRKCQTKPTEEG